MGAVDIELPKWPGLLVQGKPLTREQTSEVLVRTNDWRSTCNDREWMGEVYRLIGVGESGDWRGYEHESMEAFLAGLDVLELPYLHNSRVMSCWIGGPHGWASWTGEVFARSYNIGKWPSVRAVEDEWRVLAETFPFLDLTCQLLDCETGEVEDGEDVRPLVEYRVQGGKVETCVPAAPLTPLVLDSPRIEELFGSRFLNRGFERGVSLVRLDEALAHTRQALKERV